VHACLTLAGFDEVEPLLDAGSRAALAAVRRYVPFKQGEVWRAIGAAFAAEGLQPSDEDRWAPCAHACD
jgi:hypothetical protein